MPSFAKRSADPEIMDDLLYAGSMMDQTLRELEIINRWLGGNAVTLSALSRTVGETTQRHIEIADLGCGRGDMLRHIKRWADKRKLDVSLTGIDANPYIINAARKNLKDLSVNFRTVNVLSEEFEVLHYDIIIGTLFYHHFSDAELVAFFSRLRTFGRLKQVFTQLAMKIQKAGTIFIITFGPVTPRYKIV
jgi:SAM-dependent methyltransferase